MLSSSRGSYFNQAWNGYVGPECDVNCLLKQRLGGGLRGLANTCAIRWTGSLRAMGMDPGAIADSPWRDKEGRQYIIRVKEARLFMDAVFGRNVIRGRTQGPNGQRGWPASFYGHRGMVIFDDCDFSDASGHLDLWDGQGNVRNHDFLDRCNRVDLYNLCYPNRNANLAPFQNLVVRSHGRGGGPRGAPGPRVSTIVSISTVQVGSDAVIGFLFHILVFRRFWRASDSTRGTLTASTVRERLLPLSPSSARAV